MLACVAFLVGLIAPLTPSEGLPRPGDVLLFVGMPIVLTLAVAIRSRHAAWRACGFGVTLVIIGVTTWLFTKVL